MNSNLGEYHFIFLSLMREVFACTPGEWEGGVFTIRRNNHDFDCSIVNKAEPKSVDPSEKLLSLCESFVGFEV